jgi:hypothetical protein
MSTEDDFDQNDGEGIKSLRKQYDAQKKQLEELTTELGTYRQRDRQSAVAGLLKAKGIPEAAAKFYTAEDVSEDAVGKWASENGSLFGVQQQQEANDATSQSISRIGDATHDGDQALPGADAGQRVYGDPEKIAHALKTLPYDELVKLGYMPATGVAFNRQNR